MLVTAPRTRKEGALVCRDTSKGDLVSVLIKPSDRVQEENESLPSQVPWHTTEDQPLPCHSFTSSAWAASSTRSNVVSSNIGLGLVNEDVASMDLVPNSGYDLICTTPRLCQNNTTPVAVRGRGTTSTYNCFPATGLYFKSKVLASVGRDSTETTRLQHGSSMFGDTHAKEGGGGLAASMATWLSLSLRNENGKLKIYVVRTTLLAKSHRC